MAIDYTTCLILFIVFISSFLYLRRRRGLPPGPFPLPLIGSVGFLWKLYKSRVPIHEAFVEASRKYGPVVGIWFGPTLVIVLNGYETLHQALVNQASEFIDRPTWLLPHMQKELKKGKGLLWSDGEEWRKMRKFALQHLRAFGFGADRVEGRILEETNKVTKMLRATKAQFTSNQQIFQKAVSNVICGIIFGQNFEYDDPSFIALLDMVLLLVRSQGFLSVTNFIPEFMYPLFPKAYALFLQKKKNYDTSRDIIEKFIKSHEETFDESEIRDFLDYYIKVKRDYSLEDNLAQEPYFNSGNIYRLVYDFFLAGSETSSTALEWCLLYFIEFPEIQRKCRQEIIDVVGDNQVRLSDRAKIPYLNAFLLEVLRMSNIAPLGGPRTNLEKDVVLNGYRIPKRTIILTNLYSANMDEKYWTEPMKFNPDRFLDAKGSLVKPEAFLSFSTGPRNCPGDSLAKIEMFLFVAALLQNFDFERDYNAKPHDLSSVPGTTLVPKPYKFKAIPRSH